MQLPLIVIIGLIIVATILALATASLASAYSIVFKKYESQGKKLRRTKRGTKRMEQLMDTERALLKQKLDEVIVNDIAGLNKAFSEAKTETFNILSEMQVLAREQLKQDLTKFRTELEQKTQAEMSKVKAELNEYKKSKSQQIDSQAKAVLQDAANEILPGAIDLEKHDELVIKALEKAKSDNFFSN